MFFFFFIYLFFLLLAGSQQVAAAAVVRIIIADVTLEAIHRIQTAVAITIIPMLVMMPCPALEDWMTTKYPAVPDWTNVNFGHFTEPSPDCVVTILGHRPSGNITTQRYVI